MKVLKYHLKAKIQLKDKEEYKEYTFRHLINVRKFIGEMSNKYDVRCSKLNSSGDTYTTQCEGDSTKLFFEVKKEKIVKPKKEKKEAKKEAKKEEKKEENREYQVEAKPEKPSEIKSDKERQEEKKRQEENSS
jgi:hypothetical protein